MEVDAEAGGEPCRRGEIFYLVTCGVIALVFLIKESLSMSYAIFLGNKKVQISVRYRNVKNIMTMDVEIFLKQ